jgi:hypothetical protein
VAAEMAGSGYEEDDFAGGEGWERKCATTFAEPGR